MLGALPNPPLVLLLGFSLSETELHARLSASARRCPRRCRRTLGTKSGGPGGSWCQGQYWVGNLGPRLGTLQSTFRLSLSGTTDLGVCEVASNAWPWSIVMDAPPAIPQAASPPEEREGWRAAGRGRFDVCGRARSLPLGTHDKDASPAPVRQTPRACKGLRSSFQTDCTGGKLWQAETARTPHLHLAPPRQVAAAYLGGGVRVGRFFSSSWCFRCGPVATELQLTRRVAPRRLLGTPLLGGTARAHGSVALLHPLASGLSGTAGTPRG